MKSWEEKQEKVAQQANSGMMPPVENPFKDWMESQLDFHRKKINSQLYGIFPRNPIVPIPSASSTSTSNTGCLPIGSVINARPGVFPLQTFPGTVGDPGDLYIFDESSDYTGEVQFANISPWLTTPEFIKQNICCQADDFINVGFHHDRFVCKVCNKEKS